jgi:hypothetical protein
MKTTVRNNANNVPRREPRDFAGINVQCALRLAAFET